MRALRIHCDFPMFPDSLKSIDAVRHEAEIEIGQLGATVKRKNRGTIFIPMTSIHYAVIEDPPVILPAKAKVA